MTAVVIFALTIFLAFVVASSSSTKTEEKSRAAFKARPVEQQQEIDIDRAIVENMVDTTPSGGAIGITFLLIVAGSLWLTYIFATGGLQ